MPPAGRQLPDLVTSATIRATPRYEREFAVYIRTLKAVIAALGALAAIAVTCEPVLAERLTVGAPPSLRPALTDILPMFEREHDVAVHVVYTPSKTLMREIENGAPVDVFLSAGLDEVEHLYKKGLTLNGKPRVYAQTSLVLVMSSDSLASLISFPEALQTPTIHIALGDPQTSSLGVITAKALTKLTAYKTLPNIHYAPHSEDIIHLVRTGKADVGLVYRVDTINSGQVRISDDSPLGTYLPIQFGQAVVSTCRPALRSAAEEFSNFLMTPRIQKLLIKYGFDS